MNGITTNRNSQQPIGCEPESHPVQVQVDVWQFSTHVWPARQLKPSLNMN